MTDCAYVIGGIDQFGNGCKFVEKHDLIREEWSSVDNLQLPLFATCAVEFQKDIYLFGGATQENACARDSVYMYCSRIVSVFFLLQ